MSEKASQVPNRRANGVLPVPASQTNESAKVSVAQGRNEDSSLSDRTRRAAALVNTQQAGLLEVEDQARRPAKGHRYGQAHKLRYL